MFQNIKVDIVYYKTNTDFEMEFNLCGCCRMRLLTDKSPDKKSLIHGLARAVSRSRVIIVTGGLFGDDGIISLAAGAIGGSTSAVDGKKYGIAGDEPIEIISGATPLVTPEGIFGGCIIESGPQTMILLSDNKSVRKSIMQTLIHPYIEELCAVELKEKAAAASVAAEAPTAAEEIPATQEALPEAEPIAETEEIITDEAPSEKENIEDGDIVAADELLKEEATESAPEELEPTEAVAEEPTVESNGEAQEAAPSPDEDDNIILSGNMIFETDDEVITAPEEEEIDLYVEPQRMTRREAPKYNASYGNFLDDDTLVAEDGFNKNNGKSGKSLNLPILIITVIMLITLAVLCYCIFYVPSKDGVSASAYIHEIFNTLFG